MDLLGFEHERAGRRAGCSRSQGLVAVAGLGHDERTLLRVLGILKPAIGPKAGDQSSPDGTIRAP